MFKVNVDTGNSAFHDMFTGENDEWSEAFELIRILKVMIGQLENGSTGAKIVDINGNVVGEWER